MSTQPNMNINIVINNNVTVGRNYPPYGEAQETPDAPIPTHRIFERLPLEYRPFLESQFHTNVPMGEGRVYFTAAEDLVAAVLSSVNRTADEFRRWPFETARQVEGYRDCMAAIGMLLEGYPDEAEAYADHVLRTHLFMERQRQDYTPSVSSSNSHSFGKARNRSCD